MIYPFITLPDETEIVHSEMKSDGTVKVYVEKPVFGGFNSAVCWLPKYDWQEITGFTEDEMSYLKKLVERNAHLIIEYAQKGGFVNA